MVQALSGSTISDGAHGVVNVSSSLNASFSPANYDELKNKDADENLSDKPKAYLNYVLFDDMFNMVDENSGVKQVQGSPDELQTLSVNKLSIKKTGFLYIYTSNESGENVYFDNLVISHNSGPLLEETHYYPYGLTMSGISSNAFKGSKYPVNRIKFNSIELTSDLELFSYEAHYRNLDPQLGRWWQIDPLLHKGISPYAAMENNPIFNNDRLGDTTGHETILTYNNTADPVQRSDLGTTKYNLMVAMSSNRTYGIDINVQVSISLSAAFQGKTFESNIEQQNPGLEKEVRAHEDGHDEQYVEAANLPITISVPYNGAVETYTGTPEKAMSHGLRYFQNSTEYQNIIGQNGQETAKLRREAIYNYIIDPGMQQMTNNVDTKWPKGQPTENDANARSANKLGGQQNLKYNYTPNSINFNTLTC